MTPTAIVALVMQILALAPTLVQAVQAVEKLGELVKDGNTPTQADIDALLATLQTQSEQIQEIARADEEPYDPRN